jgi:hypothetical protein
MNRSTMTAMAVALACAFALPAAAQDAAPAEGASPAAAPVAAETPAAAEGKGKIYFFRPSRLPGAVYTYHIVEVGDDGKPAKDAPRLGDLPNGGAFILEAEPGVHSYNITGPMAVNKAEDRLRMEVEPGETYYVEQTVRIGMVTGGFRLVPADEARFTASKAVLDKGKKKAG